jgi:uncharacterized protein (DUF1778 family)
MRHGRPTMDKKESTIKLRINEDMRSWIEGRADREKISMSEYLRKLILNYMPD